MAKKPAPKQEPPAIAEISDEDKALMAMLAEPKEEEGYRDAAGHFTGNPPTLEERVGAIVELMSANGWSLPKILRK